MSFKASLVYTVSPGTPRDTYCDLVSKTKKHEKLKIKILKIHQGLFHKIWNFNY